MVWDNNSLYLQFNSSNFLTALLSGLFELDWLLAMQLYFVLASATAVCQIIFHRWSLLSEFDNDFFQAVLVYDLLPTFIYLDLVLKLFYVVIYLLFLLYDK